MQIYAQKTYFNSDTDLESLLAAFRYCGQYRDTIADTPKKLEMGSAKEGKATVSPFSQQKVEEYFIYHTPPRNTWHLKKP